MDAMLRPAFARSEGMLRRQLLAESNTFVVSPSSGVHAETLFIELILLLEMK